MTETTCPLCKAKCTITTSQHCYLCSINKNYYPLPQPDLTKLREVYSKLKNSITPYEEDWKGSYLIILWHAIKEVLNAETSNSDHGG